MHTTILSVSTNSQTKMVVSSSQENKASFFSVGVVDTVLLRIHYGTTFGTATKRYQYHQIV